LDKGRSAPPGSSSSIRSSPFLMGGQRPP
jgi:hypothetical protein